MARHVGRDEFLAKGGKMGKLIAQTDWTDHPFGPIELWPQSLRSALSICLFSKFPMAIYWGPSLRLLYNDAWSPIFAEKHPAVLGQPANVAWTDIWGLIEPDIRRVMKTGKGRLYESALLPIRRHGRTQESYFDYTFNPIYGEDQQILGVFSIGQEVTPRILHDRRLITLRDLAEKPIPVESRSAACILIANTLSEAPADIPFGLIYLLNSEKNTLHLAASTSLENDTSIAHSTIDLSVEDSILPLKKAITTKKPQLAKNLDKHYILPGGVWDEPATEAIVMPIVRTRTKEIYGVIICGISPRLRYDTAYADYFKQITELTARSIGSALDLRRKLILEMREREAQELLHTALSTGSIGIWMWDIPENKVIADQNLAYRFGIDHDEAVSGMPFSDFTDSIHPDDRADVIKKIQQTVKKTKLLEIECRTITRDGSTKWVIIRGRVEDDSAGNPVRLPGVIVDITERKEIERELASSERMFSALFESSIIGVAVITLDGKVHEANERFLTMFGYTKKDLQKGFYTHMITPSKSKGIISGFYQMLRKKGEVDPMETEYQHKDQTIVPVLAGAVMIPGSGDRCITFMLDISEQRQLLALNKAKDEFISIASHQLRTPATAVKQYLGMLREGYAGTLAPSQLRMINTAYHSNERQLMIVNDLLRVAQADADEIRLRLEPTDIAKLIKEVNEEQDNKFEDHDQTVLLKTSLVSNSANVDRLRMRMVFENLIDNAHKYSSPNTIIRITITLTRRSLKISIKDEGIGIYKKDMPKLFKKFSRIENPLSTTAGGTGLGLYWVQKVIELHQGTIAVHSKYRKGTEFIITLPREPLSTRKNQFVKPDDR